VVEVDPFGAETSRSANSAFQPHVFTSYTRDSNGVDEAMHRRYSASWSRFSQPDPYDGSYDLTDPQSFNRYSYVQNDPVNFVDRLGLDEIDIGQLGSLTIFCSFPSGIVSQGVGIHSELNPLPEQNPERPLSPGELRILETGIQNVLQGRAECMQFV